MIGTRTNPETGRKLKMCTDRDDAASLDMNAMIEAQEAALGEFAEEKMKLLMDYGDGHGHQETDEDDGVRSLVTTAINAYLSAANRNCQTPVRVVIEFNLPPAATKEDAKDFFERAIAVCHNELCAEDPMWRIGECSVAIEDRGVP